MQYSEKSKPFTLNQLADFVEKSRAMGMPDNTVVFARISFGGQLQEIRVDRDKCHPGERPQ